MKARFLKLWDDFRSGFWFLPGLFILAAILAAVGVPILDSYIADWTERNAKWIATTTEAARDSLPLMATAMISAVGVVFSITIVSLSFASTYFGSRILRNFMAHAITQVTIGTVVATSIYCLLVLRTVQNSAGSNQVPHFATLLGLVAGVASLILLVVFMHRVAISVQAQYIVSDLAEELDVAIRRLYPQRSGEIGAGDRPPRRPRTETPSSQAAAVVSDVEGYIQAVDEEGLVETATRFNRVVELLQRPGDFVQLGTQLARIRPSPAAEDMQHIAEAVNEAIVVGTRRTPRQDILCTVLEMVEVAVRALSPALNDPFTAMTVIDRLSACLGRLAERGTPSAVCHDERGNVRILANPVPFSKVLDAAFRQIRQYGISSPAVIIRLMEALRHIASKVVRSEDAEAVQRHAQMLLRGADKLWPEVNDRADLERRFLELRQQVAGKTAPSRRDGPRENLVDDEQEAPLAQEEWTI